MVNLPYIICSVLSFIPALVLHEGAHGYAAYKLGDPTAKRSGRLSLNPLKHIDPFGTVILPLLLMVMGWPVFGYAKPVPYNPRYFKDPRRDDVIVGLAGPSATLAMAALAAAVAWGCSGLVSNPAFANNELFAYFYVMFLPTFALINLYLMFFNLLPIPPLDGSSIFAILLENDRPSTPLVNAGAIAACSLVKPHGDADGKWKAIFDNMTALLGSKPQLIDELYHSESATNFDNRSITWLLQEYGRMYDDPEMSLDLYTRQCSLGVTAEQLAISAATIADDGVNPLTKKRVFGAALTSKVVALMSAVGFYEHSGDWLYATGLPAKTGVGGAVIGVMPGLFGVCAFAPPLDDAGNSVKAQAALKHLMKSLNLNVFSNTHFDLVEE